MDKTKAVNIVSYSTLAAVFLYLFGVTFLHVPKENAAWVNTIVPFLLGTVVGSVISYYMGGTPDKKSGTQTTGTAEINATLKTDTTPETKE